MQGILNEMKTTLTFGPNVYICALSSIALSSLKYNRYMCMRKCVRLAFILNGCVVTLFINSSVLFFYQFQCILLKKKLNKNMIHAEVCDTFIF